MNLNVAHVLLATCLTVFAAEALPAVTPDPVTTAGEEPKAEVNEEAGEEADGDITEILVTGQRPSVLRQYMNDFVLEIGEPASSARGYARWQGRICTGVYNLPDPTLSQYIADKITLMALELGLRTGSPGCEPNLHIVFSPDARALATQMVESSPRMFLPYGGAGGTTRGLGALEQFKTSEAPVRWWQITMVVDETGLPAIDLGVCLIDMATGTCGVRQIRGVASRLKAPINDAIWGSLIIVDANKVGKVQWPQLAEYLTMVALAQVDPDGQPSNYDSILNLFTASSPPLGLTEMDRLYLEALYSMDLMTFPHAQRGIFTSRMMREFRELTEVE